MANKLTTMLQNAPLPELIENLGKAIAEAQFALDLKSIDIAVLLGDKTNHGVEVGGVRHSLLELGFAPTFYHLTEATVETRVAFSTSSTQEFSVGASATATFGVVAVSVEASYSAKYSFEASGSSSIQARFVSIPPPALFEERLRAAIVEASGNSEG